MILDFAVSRNNFTLCELAEYVRSKNAISVSGILWHLNKLIKEKKLSRLSRGIYGTFVKREFTPMISDELKQLYEDISLN